MRTRPLPIRKSLGTDYNLRPDTEPVEARSLRVGDVVMESRDHPVRISQIGGLSRVWLHGNYIWESDERTWPLGNFNMAHLFERAVQGEY